MTIHRTRYTLINIGQYEISNSLFRFVYFSTHTILRTSKSIGNNTMKKMLLATALALLITGGCAQQTFTVQNKPAAVAPKCLITIIVSERAEENCRCS